MTPELHRPLSTERIGPGGLTVDVQANAAECAALAARMQIPRVKAMRCRFRLEAGPGDSVVAVGRLTARVVQTCVVSLDDFESAVEEAFRVRFVPAGTETDDPDPESDDEIPYVHGILDLGEAAAEQLALGLDPYPRRPDAELPVAETAEPDHPFATLRRTS